MGVEHPWKSPNNTHVLQAGGAESGAPATFPTVTGPDLQRMIDAWPTLPEAIENGIMAMVKAAR